MAPSAWSCVRRRLRRPSPALCLRVLSGHVRFGLRGFVPSRSSAPRIGASYCVSPGGRVLSETAPTSIGRGAMLGATPARMVEVSEDRRDEEVQEAPHDTLDLILRVRTGEVTYPQPPPTRAPGIAHAGRYITAVAHSRLTLVSRTAGQVTRHCCTCTVRPARKRGAGRPRARRCSSGSRSSSSDPGDGESEPDKGPAPPHRLLGSSVTSWAVGSLGTAR